jgi:hypothetical protein
MGVVALFFIGTFILLISKPVQNGDSAVIASADQLTMAATSAPAADKTTGQNPDTTPPAKIEQRNVSPSAKTTTAKVQLKKKSGDETSSAGLSRHQSDMQSADDQPAQNFRAGQNQVAVSKNHQARDKKPAVAPANSDQPAYISINCAEGTEVFVDNTARGKVAAGPLNLKVNTGKHMIRVSHPKWGNVEKIVVTEADKTLQLKSDFCAE